jgi:hypothetical protein
LEPVVRHDGVKRHDAGELSIGGRLPKSSTQDSLAGGIAALLRPG